MSDRIVRKISPREPNDPADRVWKYSDFANAPNIVLLGDPGAGKSHLLREAADVANGLWLTTRAFLNDPDIPTASVLFIDALDEKRAGRRDQATIDAVVQKLFQLKPVRVRIACRAHDWLGGTDLAVFRPYFDQHGGVFVLELEPLTKAEQHAVVRANNLEDPEKFIAEAEKRGLHDFLTNPQNLTMLIEAVSEGDWPSTRSELFETTSRILVVDLTRFQMDADDPSSLVPAYFDNYLSSKVCVSGELWCTAFGEIGDQILKRPEFEGKTSLDRRLQRRGIFFEYPYLMAVAFIVRDLDGVPKIYALHRVTPQYDGLAQPTALGEHETYEILDKLCDASNDDDNGNGYRFSYRP